MKDKKGKHNLQVENSKGKIIVKKYFQIQGIEEKNKNKTS